uniref:Secreted protein n=1 Tax=Echinococcus granulosus TaxID=6210 RepID=U6FVL8_ECHGR|nr:hypothetical protein EgrG_002067900 [Echinococcus granulosus]
MSGNGCSFCLVACTSIACLTMLSAIRKVGRLIQATSLSIKYRANAMERVIGVVEMQVTSEISLFLSSNLSSSPHPLSTSLHFTLTLSQDNSVPHQLSFHHHLHILQLLLLILLLLPHLSNPSISPPELVSMILFDHSNSVMAIANPSPLHFHPHGSANSAHTCICSALISSQISPVEELVITSEWWALRTSAVASPPTRVGSIYSRIAQLPIKTWHHCIDNQSNNKSIHK